MNPIKSQLLPEEIERLVGLPDPALVVDAFNGCILSANALALSGTGYDEGEILGLSLDRLFKFAEETGLDQLLENGSGNRAGTSARVRRKDGSDYPVLATASHLKGDGRPYLIEFSDPVVASAPSASSSSTRKDADSSQIRYRELFENSNDLVFTHDLRGQITSANRATLTALGLSLDSVLGCTILDFVDEEYVSKAQYQIARRLKRGGASDAYRLLCRAADGSPIWLEVTTRLIVVDGTPEEFQVIGRDLTESRASEAELEESKRQLRDQQNLLEKMIHQHPYAVAFWHPDGSFDQCNDAFVRLIGVRPTSDYNLLRDPQIEAAGQIENLRKAFTGETVQIEPISYDIGNNGWAGEIPSRPVCLSVTAFPIVDAHGAIDSVATIYKDLADQVEAEKLREKLEEQLLQSQKMEAIGRLAGGVAHDFNNLLTGVIGYLDVIRSMTEPAVHPYVVKAEVAAQRGCDLTRQLLAYARKSPMEAKPLDVNETVVEVAALLRQTVDKRIAIETSTLDGSATLLADSGQMSQVLMNLCINARDALNEKIVKTPPSDSASWQPKIRIETKIEEVTAEYCRKQTHAREGRFVRISVEDNGPGVNEAIRGRIFDPFFTTKPRGKGTGLGLATLLGIVNQHEGWVDVYSEPDKGSVFTVYLPSVDEPAEPLSTAGVILRVRGGDESIMLVDDEEMIRDLGKDILEAKGYAVRLAVNGREALEIFERDKDEIDLIVLDLTMPELSGGELLPLLLALKPEQKVVISSGYSEDENAHSLIDAGAKAFIQKPYTSTELTRVVRKVLESK